MNPDTADKKGYCREITIPGDVLHDDRLSDGAKIMYGKIARLTYKTGECWASNAFLDGTQTGRNASRMVAELKKAGYLLIENEGSKARKIRICAVNSRITPADLGADAGSPEQPAEPTSPILAGLEDHTANLANSGGVATTLSTITDDNSERTSPHMAGLETLLRQFCHEFLTNLANYGGLTSPNMATEHLKLTAAVAACESTDSNADPPPTGEPAAAAIMQQDLKNALLDVDPTLFLKDAFYPQAAAFMSFHGLDNGYLS